MATTKPRKSPAEVEDIILQKIFCVTLAGAADAESGVVYLETMAAVILNEGKELLLSRELMERVLIARLSGNFSAFEPPFPYLLGCYRCAHDESKKIQSMIKDNNLRSEMEIVTREAKNLAVFYCRKYLANPYLFENSDITRGRRDRRSGWYSRLKNRNVSPILPLILAESCSGDSDMYASSSSAVQSPPGFLDEFFDSDFVSLDPILKELYEDLMTVIDVSVLGNFQPSLKALEYLISLPVGAEALVSHECWIIEPANRSGRTMELRTILGPFFHISALPDHRLFKSQPGVGQLCFSGRLPAELLSNFSAIKASTNILYRGLHNVLLILLEKDADTKECVLQFLAKVINANASRAHIKVDPYTCASSGMFVNLSAVMLRLCEPFLYPHPTKMDKIDPKYALCGHRLKLSDLTTLHASPNEVSEWIAKDANGKESHLLQSEEATSSSSNAHGQNAKATKEYSFTCECFFMTARVLNLGLLKALSDFKQLVQDISRGEDNLAALKAMRGDPQLERRITRMERELELDLQEKLCHEAQILKDEDFIKRALSFYHLVVGWLVGLVGGFKMPLPATCPMEFSGMPEHFVEDAMELLILASRIPNALDGVLLDDFMNFIIKFMASPEYIRNPYLRAKMVEVLNCWIPRSSGSSAFALHQLSLEYLVRNLLKLYVEIESTGSDTQFNDKFNIRHNITELLEHLWQVPSHRNAWRQIAKEEEKGLYLKFLNLLVNDSIYLLDESLNKILEIKKLEAEMSNTAEWEQRPAQERREIIRLYHSQDQNIIRMDMKLADEDLRMLVFTSEEITAPFLLPEMVERVANMLNYFLLQFVGPLRKSLSLKDLEKYEFRPKQLLKLIVRIYVNLAKGDKENIFPGAISSDGRSYNEQLFNDGAILLTRIDEDSKIIQEFMQLGTRAKAAASEAVDAEAALGNIPADFLDPLQSTVMRDPVILPSSRITVDRPSIQRCLLEKNEDPYTREPLTSGMLIPNTKLKARIEAFLMSKGTREEDSSN